MSKTDAKKNFGFICIKVNQTRLRAHLASPTRIRANNTAKAQAQVGFQHLAAGIRGQIRHDVDVFGGFEPCLRAATI